MKLSQILATEKKLVPTNDGYLTEIQLLIRKESFFNGFHRRYVPLKVEGDKEAETFPDESVRVQQKVDDLIIRTANWWTDTFDITFSKDAANMTAKADVKVNGKILLSNAPVSYLLWLDKRLQEVRTFYASLPTLSEAEEWIKDSEAGMWRAKAVTTHRTKKTTVPLVLYPHQGDKLPAQVTTLQEDITVGHYEKQNFSGAIPATRRAKLLERVDVLIYAVKQARAEANSMEAEHLKISKPIFDYLLAEE